jgi:hypothetical protein
MAAYQTSFRGPNKEVEEEVGRYFYPFLVRREGGTTRLACGDSEPERRLEGQ